MATLRLNKAVAQAPAVAEPEATKPVFNKDRHHAEIYGEPGIRYAQGKGLFNARGDFVRYAEGPGEPVLTDEEEEAVRRARLRKQKTFGRQVQIAVAAIPQKVLDAQRENAQALAAESQAA